MHLLATDSFRERHIAPHFTCPAGALGVTTSGMGPPLGVRVSGVPRFASTASAPARANRGQPSFGASGWQVGRLAASELAGWQVGRLAASELAGWQVGSKRVGRLAGWQQASWQQASWQVGRLAASELAASEPVTVYPAASRASPCSGRP